MFKIAYYTNYSHPVPENHRFPMAKYELLYEQLLLENIAEKKDFFTPSKAQIADICLAHKKEYVESFINLSLSKSEARKIGFTQDKMLIDRELTLVQGTIQGAILAWNGQKIAFNIAGGTHHAYSDRGEAFCMLNDQAVATMFLLKNTFVKKILIIDLDVHQGNGTAEIFGNNPKVFTFSMHGKNNYPFEKEKSDLDIPLDDKTSDNQYLSILKNILPKLIETEKPDFIFYQSGVDVLASDKLGRLSLSVEGCADRDKIVFELCEKYQIPVQCAMGGGYSPDLVTIIKAHTNTFRVAKDIFD
ncbi:MAG: histone deacetylase [Capnocytophaga sp.]|nr:histone deacetylase [Capnocytophaga sp.]